ncbi:SGM_3592 family protein [Streptomyces specialis]|uniref:SGM_3592 family protein n=1 Tax=Streptomyces specialis TaxID=498367 RepID=UPI00073E58B7|nr:hypothetical protein [Streptomyces specialis]
MGTEPTGRDDPQGDEWDDVVLDESFVRGAEVREPAARTRMLSERWKDGGPTPQPWRSDEPPAGWIYGSGRRGKAGGPGKRRWFRRKGKDGGGE